MVDPISIIGLVGQVADLLQRVYEYGKAVREAHSEMQKLWGELIALKGALEQLQKLHAPSNTSDQGGAAIVMSNEFRQTLKSTRDIVQRLVESLAKKQTSSRKRNALLWPFVKEDVAADIQALERVKSWFVMMMMAENLTEMRTLLKESHKIIDVVMEEQANRKRNEELLEREKVREWLQPVSPLRIHDSSLSKRMAQTGKWFLQGQLQAWRDGLQDSPRIVWLRGKSGSGKTSMLSAAVEEMINVRGSDPEIGVAYFYCSFSDRDSQEPSSVLGSILFQVCEQVEDAMNHLRKIHTKGKKLSLSEMHALILQHLSSLQGFFILVDAINESHRYTEVLDQLFSLVAGHGKICLLVTSTSTWSSAAAGTTPDKHPKILEIDMGTASVTEDIRSYVKARMENGRLLKRLSIDEKAELEARLLRNADRMFRYAECQLDYLTSLRTTRMVKDALDDLPSDINATYTAILERIPKSDRSLASETLLLLTGSLRPLTILELAEAAVFEPTDTSIEDDMRLPEPEALLEICQGLIEYDKASRVMTLAHASVRTFLTSLVSTDRPQHWFAFDGPNLHARMAEKCLTYLLFDNFKGGFQQFKDYAKMLNRYPFLDYASHHWPAHTKMCTWTCGLEKTALRFCSTHTPPKGGNFSLWVQCLMPRADHDRLRLTEPLYYAASFGLIDLVRSLLNTKQVDIEAYGGRYESSALHSAVYRNHVETARLLIEHGASVNAQDSGGMTPIFWARQRGNRDMIELLKAELLKPSGQATQDEVKQARFEGQSLWSGKPSKDGGGLRYMPMR